MKTFFYFLVFAVVILGFTASVSADTALFDWANPSNALVFATEISSLSHGERSVEIDYAVKDNVLYSRMTFDNNDYAELGFQGLNIFGGNERAVGSPETDSRFFYKDNSSSNLMDYYEYAVQNDNVIAADYRVSYGTTLAYIFDTNFLNEFGKDYFANEIVDIAGSFVDGINSMFTMHNGAYYVVNEEDGFLANQYGEWLYGGATEFTATYSDGVLTVLANGEFLASFSYSGGDYLEYAFSLEGLGLDNYNGIHLASQLENYYTFLDFSQGTFYASTPEPATALIFGLAGGIAIPFLRRKRKKA
ncbi:MAG: hypothetical protein LBC20_18490 [Planctomycetaceae bacterium]|jgi:hypothetical protein|nr:hypothetical protein [Planctomycetaceae bacterium]